MVLHWTSLIVTFATAIAPMHHFTRTLPLSGTCLFPRLVGLCLFLLYFRKFFVSFPFLLISELDWHFCSIKYAIVASVFMSEMIFHLNRNVNHLSPILNSMHVNCCFLFIRWNGKYYFLVMTFTLHASAPYILLIQLLFHLLIRYK